MMIKKFGDVFKDSCFINEKCSHQYNKLNARSGFSSLSTTPKIKLLHVGEVKVWSFSPNQSHPKNVLW